MSFQILDIILYNPSGESRVVSFRTGAANIITGRAQTGKTAIIDIVEYCLGRETFIIPEGVIRESVSWYAVRLQADDQQVFIARPRPEGNRASSNQVYLEFGVAVEIVPLERLSANSTTDALEAYLTQMVGIAPNIHRPLEGQTRRDLEATIRHALFFTFQAQDEIGKRAQLFHRQNEQFVPQAIKDTLPYFLGAVQDGQLALEHELRLAQRKLALAERRLRELDQLQGEGWSRVQELLVEARQVGILADGPIPTDFGDAVNLLRPVLGWTPETTSPQAGDYLSAMMEERQSLLESEAVLAERILAARSFAAETDSYSSEAYHQQLRLESINLYGSVDHESSCPLCSSPLESPPPAISAIREMLTSIKNNLDAATRERPKLRGFIEQLEAERAGVRQQVRDLESTIDELLRERAEAQRIRDLNVRRARVVGRISLFLESVTEGDVLVPVREDVESARREVERLQERLAPEQEQDYLLSALNRIGQQLTTWAAQLRLEHSENPVRLDLSRLTLVVDRPERPITMERMGSGANWVGYHLIAHLALHQWFVQRGRPVPAFLILDQLTQAWFPADPDVTDPNADQVLNEEDRETVLTMFNLIFDLVDALAPKFQVIILDHAYFSDERYQSHVIENWRGGRALVPRSWYDTPANAETEEK